MRSATNVAAYRALGGTFEQFCQDIGAGAIVFDDETLRDFFHHYTGKKNRLRPCTLAHVQDPILKNYYLHHEPTTVEKHEAILIHEIASTLHLNEPEVANFFCHGSDYAKATRPCENLYGAGYDINEQLMDSILLAAETSSDLDMEHISSYFAEVASIPENERLFAGTPREFKPPSEDIDEIWLVLVTEADDPSHGDLNTSRGEIRVTKDMIKIDEHKLRDLKGYPPPEVRRRLIVAAIKEIAQLCELGSFAFYKSETKVDTVGSKLIYKIKYDTDGKFIKDKARLVAKGFQERVGKDFFSTFSPMASLTTVRILSALAVRHGLPLYAADVPNAFCRSAIKSIVHLELPPGVSFETADKSTRDGYSVRLLKSLYGLKSAPMIFNNYLCGILEKDLGYHRFVSDTSLFGKRFDDGSWSLIATEVDDLFIVNSREDRTTELKHQLHQHLEVAEFGPIRSYFGVRFIQDLDKGTLTLDVEKQITDFFKKHPKLSTLHPAATPSSAKDAELPDQSTPMEIYIREHYRSIVGVLIFPSITCRPDLSYETARAARHMASPTRSSIQRLLHLLRYVNGHRGTKLLYAQSGGAPRKHFEHLPSFVTIVGKSPAPTDQGLDTTIGMVDANFAPDYEPTRKSTSGYCFFFLCCLVSWKAKLQPFTTSSSHDSETVAAALAADEAVWLRKLITEMLTFLGSPLLEPNSVVNMYGDNLAAIFTANNPTTSTRSRHLDIRFFKIRDYIKDHKLVFMHCAGTKNCADFCTKPGGREHLDHLRHMGLQI